MNIAFYFDPSCPFCWITSRWLLQVSNKRDITIEWVPFSLTLKNNELEPEAKHTPYAEEHYAAHRVIRVIEAATEHGGSLIDLYTRFGISYHLGEEKFTDSLIEEILNEQKLPASLLKEADNKKWDPILQKKIDQAVAVVGNDIGVPTIIFQNSKGQKQGFFGPVLQDLPEIDESVKLWDAISALAQSSHFYELKRARPSGMPDVVSTAHC